MLLITPSKVPGGVKVRHDLGRVGQGLPTGSRGTGVSIFPRTHYLTQPKRAGWGWWELTFGAVGGVFGAREGLLGSYKVQSFGHEFVAGKVFLFQN